MKHSSPISLFSFQDIITSLTGILIVIVLIIALELVETMATVAARSELLPDYLCLKQKAAELSDTKTALQQSLASNDSPQGPFADLSLPELRDLIAREKRYQALLTEKNRTEDLLYSDLAHENEQISKLSKAVAASSISTSWLSANEPCSACPFKARPTASPSWSSATPGDSGPNATHTAP